MKNHRSNYFNLHISDIPGPVLAPMLERKQYLETLLLRIDQTLSLIDAPQGKLRISCSYGRKQYYLRPSADIRSGNYIGSGDCKTASALAQKDYCEKTRSAILTELDALNRFIEKYPSVTAEDVYEHLSSARRELVTPYEETLESFIDRWLSEPYEQKYISSDLPELVSDKGDRVRSKSELMIANLLYEKKIPYRYECSLYLDGFGLIYPDFTVLDTRSRKEVCWEHLGMMDDPDYVNKNLRRESAYIMNGYYPGERLSLTYETEELPINLRQVRAIIQHYFE